MFEREGSLAGEKGLKVYRTSLCSVAVPQPSAHTPAEQEEGAVHLTAVRRQHRPADHDPHLAQLAGGVHQQLPLQLGRQQLLRTPLSRPWNQVPGTACSVCPHWYSTFHIFQWFLQNWERGASRSVPGVIIAVGAGRHIVSSVQQQ